MAAFSAPLKPASIDHEVIPEVLEEHLDQVGYGIRKLEQTHGHPSLSLTDLTRGVESRLLADLDGLLIASPRATAALAEPLLPDLRDYDTGPAAALALVFARVGDLEGLQALLGHENPAVRTGALAGCRVGMTPELGQLALQALAKAPAGSDASTWLELAAIAPLRPPNLPSWLMSSLEPVQAAALYCLRGERVPASSLAVQRLCESPSQAVRARALRVGLTWGEPWAWRRCEADALDLEQVHAWAMIAYALLGGPREHARLAQLRSRPSHRLWALRALGYSGNLGTVPFLLEHLSASQAVEAKVAAHAIAAITGLDLRDSAFRSNGPSTEEEPLPPLDEDDLDADLTPQPEEALPAPNGPAIQRWCVRFASTRTASKRHVLGEPLSEDALFHALEAGPLGLRHGWSLALAFRSRGRVLLNTQTFSREQRRAMAAGRGALQRFSPNPFSEW
jgi:uncharacterized protein (TIGR02270 family)